MYKTLYIIKTVTTSKFRKNQKQILHLAEKERIITHRPKGKDFILVPLDMIENKAYDPKFVAKILRGEKQIKEGEFIVHDSTKSIWD